MTEPDTISADYSLRPSELASTLALLVEARQPVVVWGAPAGCAKSQIAQQVAAQAGRYEYVDVRALLLDPVDRAARHPVAGLRPKRRPHPLGRRVPCFPAARSRRGRKLADQSCKRNCPRLLPMVQAALYLARARPQMRRVRTPRGRRADRLRQPTEGDRGRASTACRTPLASRFVPRT